MMKKLIAITLCLALTLLACACAASNATVSTPEQPGTSTPASQMSSQPEPSDEISKPTEPTLPEEKETTLEKVLSFEIGEDGLLSYYLLSPPDDIDPPMLNIMGSLYTDGKGTFYHTQENRILCINDGTWLPVFYSDQILDIEICENDFYVLTTHGTVYCYDISLGFEQATLSGTYTVFDGVGADDGELCHFGESVPLFRSDTGVFYTLDKKQLSREKAPFHKEQSDTELSVLSQNGSFVISGKDLDRYEVYTVSSENIGLFERDLDTGNCICTVYNNNGEISTRFLYTRSSSSDMQSCQIKAKYSGKSILVNEHIRRRASIGQHSFEELLNSTLFCSWDGGVYFAAYYADRCDIYRITPGYSDVQFTTKES